MDDDLKKYSEFSSYYIRYYSHNHGKDIYNFMKKYNIGESEFGKIMDNAAKGKQVIAHRLYGHNLIYDFPFENPDKIFEFLEHELSDLFTKQGLPIIPGEILENTNLLKYCNKLTSNWNFVNGFDILSGTIAIWQGAEKFKQTFNNEISVDNFEDFAKTIGVGAIELAIALSSANPFLLIAACLHLTSGVKGMFNEGAVILFRKNIEYLMIEFSIDSLNINEYIKNYSIQTSIEQLSINNSINKLKLKTY